MAVSFTPLQLTLGIAHGDLRLVYSCSAMETHFMKLPTNSFCADVASRGSLELSSECCNRGQTIFTCCSLQHSAVLFCELVWLTTSWLSRCCSLTFPLHNNSTYSTSSEEVWRTDFLERWHPILALRWKSRKSSVWPFYCQCLSMEIACLYAWFYTPVRNGCVWNPLFTNPLFWRVHILL